MTLKRRSTHLKKLDRLQVNEQKTKFPRQSRSPRKRRRQNYNSEVVNEFTHIGANINVTNNETEKIQKKLAAENTAYFSLAPILRSNCINRKIKARL